MKFKINFVDVIEAGCEEEAYDKLLSYLQEVVNYKDVTAFDFETIER